MENTKIENESAAYSLQENANETDIQESNKIYDEKNIKEISVEYNAGLHKINEELFGNDNHDTFLAHTVFMSAAGTWQSVSQCMNVRIRDDEIW